MMKWKKILMGGASCLLASLLVIFAVSCGNKSPTVFGDHPENYDLDAITAVDLTRNSAVNTGGLAKPDKDVYMLDDAEASASFNEEGGELKIRLDHQDIFFIVPEEAFSGSNEYEIRIRGEKWNTEYGVVFFYDCSPEGLNFAEPLILVQPLSNTDRDVENLYWKEPNTGEWVVEDVEQVISGEARFEIHHFSKYAISD